MEWKKYVLEIKDSSDLRRDVIEPMEISFESPEAARRRLDEAWEDGWHSETDWKPVVWNKGEWRKVWRGTRLIHSVVVMVLKPKEVV